MPPSGPLDPYGPPPAHPPSPYTPTSTPSRQTPIPTPTLHDRYRSCIALPAIPTSVATARIHTRDLLTRWHLPTAIDDAVLVVAELLTNAIKATASIPPQATYPDLYDHLEVVCLSLYHLPGELLIEVWDPNREPPLPRTATPDEETGRGLLLVNSLTLAWGTHWPPLGGKTIWATLTLDPPN
ncbi:ATP-binding protein [Thermopolyspora sp. NPDC052614]|uniref:ATP-binding protein n=1 Tax=Thermopolyspora sp. NPDC052614 TaxID=3155682 RepID=UPI003430189E